MKNKLLWTLVLKNIKYEKKRGVLIAFTIMLAVWLVFSVLTYWNSYNNVQKNEAKDKEGNYHAEYMGVSEWQANKIKDNKSIDHCYIAKEAKNVKVVNEKLVENYINLKVISFDQVDDVCSFYKGRLPIKEDEIVIDKWVLETLGLDPEINQKIKVDFNIENKENQADKKETKEFKIVGILNDIESLRANGYSYLIVDNAYLNQLTDDITYNVKIALKSNFECEKQIKSIATKLGIIEDDIRFNVSYIDAYGISLLEILEITILIIIIFFIAGMVVFNVYNIYFTKMVKIYGIYKAIGTTDQQLKKLTFYESFILGTIGNFSGIIVGIGVSYWITPFIDKINNDLSKIVVEISFSSIIISILVGYFIVVGAAIYPYRKMKRISVVTAYNYNPINISKHIKTKIVKKVNVKYLAYIRISRYRNKIILNILSMSLLYLLFVVTSSILGSMNTDNLSNTMLGGDYSIQISDEISRGEEKKDLLNEKFIDKLKKVEGIEKCDNIMYDRMIWEVDSAKKCIELPEEYRELGIGIDSIDSLIYGYDDEFLMENQKYLVDGEINIDELKNKNSVVVVEDGITHVNVGEKINLITPTGNQVTLRVAGIVSNNITYRGYKASGCDIIMHQNLFKKLDLDTRVQRIAITANSGKEMQVQSHLEELIDNQKDQEEIAVVSYVDLNKEFEENKKIVTIVSYSFLLILGLIVIFNSINTTLTNMLSRKKELGVLEAIGLTSKQEKRLLLTENLLTICISSVIGMGIGFPLGYIGFLIFKKQANYAIYHLPIVESFLVAVLFFLGQMIITKKCNDIMNKQSVIEKIRYKE